MANIHLHVPSFNAGELSPLLGARFAVEKVQAGCRRMRNFIPHVHGPAFRRPGMEYMGPSGGPGNRSSLRGFNFSTSTGFILEFYSSGLQVWSNGQRVLLISQPERWLSSDPLKQVWPYDSDQVCADLQIAQANDVCYITHPDHPPRKLTRHADADWRLEEITWQWPAFGDENERSTEIASPTVALIGERPTQLWPEFTMPAEVNFTISVVSPSLGAVKRFAKIWRWIPNAKPQNGKWEHFDSGDLPLNWTTAGPAAVTRTSPSPETKWRVTYEAPAGAIHAAGSKVVVEWDGGSFELPLDGTQVDSTQPWQPPSRQPVTMPAGEWQMTVECGPAIPAGAILNAQKKVGAAWQVDKNGKPVYINLELKPGRVIIVRGEKLGEPTAYRFVWDTSFPDKTANPKDRAMLDAGGAPAVMRFENIVFPVSKDINITVNGVNGTGREMIATGGKSERIVNCTLNATTTITCASTTGLKKGLRLTAPQLAPNTSVDSVAPDGITFVVNQVPLTPGTGITLEILRSIFLPEHVGSFWQIEHRREASSVEIKSAVGTIVAAEGASIRVSGQWEVFTYGTWEATLFLERKVSGTWEVIRSWTGNRDRNIIASGEEDNEVEMRLRVTGGTSAAESGEAAPRFVLEASDARVVGLVKITAVGGLSPDGKASSATVDIITDLYSTAPTTLWTEGAWSGVRGYPRAVALHGQRLWFGGSKAEPRRLWGSVVNDYENFRRTSLDDGSVSFTPAAQQSNRLQWMVSYGENLVLGTDGDEWTVTGGSERGPITPTSVQIQRRSGYGSRYIPALLIGETIAFVQRGGRKLRSVAPRQDGLTWMASDLTVLAEHVAQTGIVQVAAMHHPQTILWAVTGDGKLLGMTFEQEQNVFAWHVHETDGGWVESVAVVFGAEADEVWLAVRRKINGEMKRSIERFDVRAMSRQFSDPARLIYLDSAVVLEPVAPATTLTRLTGLEHLEGCKVLVLGDNVEMSPGTVNEGAVNLPQPVKVAVVGLPYTSELQPMRLEIPLQDGSAQHRQWRTSRVGLFLHESLGGEIADGPEARFEKLSYRFVSTPVQAPPPLYSGEKETAIESHARAGVDVVVRTSDAYPLNIGSVTVKGDVYGE